MIIGTTYQIYFCFYRKKEKGKRINPFSLFLLALVKEMLQR